MAVLIRLRPILPADLPKVMQIERECFTLPWQESAYLTEISNKSAYYIAACIDDEILGFAGMWVIMDEAHITTLGVAKNARGKKIGEQLLLGLLDEAIKRGGHRATLEVRQSNVIAQNLYKKYGFTAAAIRRGYYTDNDENGIVMWLDDLATEAFAKRVREFREKYISFDFGACVEDVN